MNKLHLLLTTLVTICTFYLAQTQTVVLFIESNRTTKCWPYDPATDCDGSFGTPFDSFKYMLNYYPFQNHYTYIIMFLGKENTDHYILPNENSYYNNIGYQEYFQSLDDITFILRPTFCTDPNYYVNDNNNKNCIQTSPSITLHWKNIDYTIHSKSFTIENLIIDGSDTVIAKDDPCMSKREDCCEGICTPSISLTLNTNLAYGLFTTKAFTATNVQFNNILSLNNTSLITFTTSITITMTGCNFNSVYFPKGIISNFMLTNDNLASTSSITISNVKVYNYNDRNIFNTNLVSLEGYFINLPAKYVGTISISNSDFQNLKNSYIQNTCTSQALFPNTNTKESYMTDAYRQSIKNKNSYSTGVIAIKSLQGTVKITSTQFYNIAGYSGTVLAIMDMLATSNVTISGCTIKNNFVFSNTATIKIYQSPSGNNFVSSASCQAITISSNTINFNSGCPGAAANIVVSCGANLESGKQYLDTSTTNLNTFTQFFNAGQNKLQVTGNTFNYNSLVYSNSLLVYGFTGVLISGNTFTNNAIQTPNNTMASTQYSNLQLSLNSIWTTYYNSFTFQSTSPIFMSLCTLVQINSNVFDNNWCLNSSTTLRGSQITIDNAIIIGSTSFQIKSNTFKNNQGIAPYMATYNQEAGYTITTSIPIITVNFANVDNYLSSISSTLNEMVLDSNTFLDNVFNYNIPYSYNHIISTDINDYLPFIRIFDENDKNTGTSGWVKKTTDSQVQLTIKSSIFENNKIIITSSITTYLFINNIIKGIYIKDCQFIGNRIITLQRTAKIYTSGVNLTNECTDNKDFCWKTPDTGTDISIVSKITPALFGIWTKNSLESFMNISGCTFKSNVGMVFQAFLDTGIPITLNATGNIFYNITLYSGQGSILVWNRTTGNIIMNNNNISNTQGFQTIMNFISGPSTYTENGNLYANNTVYLAIKYLVYDVSRDGEANTNNPTRQYTHTSTGSIYSNNTISSGNIPNIGSVSSLIVGVANNAKLTYSEINSKINDVSANYVYIIMNQATYSANNITYECLIYEPITFIIISNNTMTITNSKIISYPAIDNTVLLTDGIITPFSINAVNSQISISNSIIGMYMNIITAQNCSITFSNVTGRANFTIGIPVLLFKGFIFHPIFLLQNCDMSVNGSSFFSNNGFIDAQLSNFTFNGSTVGDYHEDTKTSWAVAANQIINCNFTIAKSKLGQLSSRYYFESSNASLSEIAIWGYLNNQKLTIELGKTSLNLTNVLFTNLVYELTIASFSTVNTNGLIFNSVNLLLDIRNSSFPINGLIGINSGLDIQTINSTFKLNYTECLQSVNLGAALQFTTPYDYLFTTFHSFLTQTTQLTSILKVKIQNVSLDIDNLNMNKTNLDIDCTNSNLSITTGEVYSGDFDIKILNTPFVYNDFKLTSTNIKIDSDYSLISMTNITTNLLASLGNMFYDLKNGGLTIDTMNANNSNLKIISSLSNVSLNNFNISQVNPSSNAIMIFTDNPIAILNNTQFLNNSYFQFETLNTTIKIINTTISQQDNDQAMSIKFNYSILSIQNTSFSDNHGLIAITGYNATLENVNISGKGPHLNSGGIGINIVNADVNITNITIADNYAAMISRASNINITNLAILENYHDWYINTNVFVSLAKINSLFLFSQCNIIIKNANISNSNEFLAIANTNITITNLTLVSHVKLDLSADVFKMLSSRVIMTNCTIMGYNIQSYALLMFETPSLVNMTGIIFINNTIANSYLINLYNPNNVTLDNIVLYDNNALIKSKGIQILIASGVIVNIFNSIFNTTVDINSYHLYFKTHVSTTSLTNVTFAPASNILFSSSLHNLIITNCTIIGNDSQPFTNVTTPEELFYIEHNELTVINNSIFQGLVTYNGIFYLRLLTKDMFIFENTIFQNNRAFFGSAINSNSFGDESLIITKNVTFLNNSANVMTNISVIPPDDSGYGGAIYFYCFENLFCNFTLTNTTFENNTANITAGGIFSNYFPPFIDVDTVIFKGNDAPFGKDVSSNPIQFVILSPNSSSTIKSNIDWQSLYFDGTQNGNISNSSLRRVLQERVASIQKTASLVSGRIISSFLEIYTLDIYQQVAGSDITTEITITFNDTEYEPTTYDKVLPTVQPMTNLSRVKVQNGLYKYDNVLLNFWPGSKTSAHFEVHNLGKLPPYITSKIPADLLAQMSAALSLRFNYRNCVMGEVFLDTGTCYPCGEGFYSLVIPNNSKHPCEECDFETSYCLGVEKVAPKPNYWRKNESATIILRCPNDAACLGSPANLTTYNATGICADGFSGHLCNVCPEGSINADNSCINCNSSIWYYLRLGLIILVQSLLIGLSVKATVESLQNVVNEESSKLDNNDLQSAVAIKILTNFVQMISIIRLFDFQWPTLLTSLVGINEQLGGNSMQYFSIDCILLFLFPSAGDGLTYIKYLSIFLTPFVFTFIAILIWLAIYYRGKVRPYDKKALMKRIVTTIVVLNFNFQPNLILYALLIFQCENIYRVDLPEYYLTSNYQIQCYTNDYIFKAMPLGIFNVALWGVIFPLGIFIYLKVNQDKLHTEEVKSKFSFIYEGYKYDKFYWEQINLIRKILLIATYVFIRLISVKIQAWFVFAIIFISLILQLKNQPLLNDNLNYLEGKAQFCNVFMAFAALYYMLGPGAYYLDTTIIVLCIASNAWFLIGWALFYIKMQWKTLKNNKILIKTKSYYNQLHLYYKNRKLRKTKDYSVKDQSVLINNNLSGLFHPQSQSFNAKGDNQKTYEYPEKIEEGIVISNVNLHDIQTTKKRKYKKPKSIDLELEIQNILDIPLSNDDLLNKLEKHNDENDLKKSEIMKLMEEFDSTKKLHHRIHSDPNMIPREENLDANHNPILNLQLELEKIVDEPVASPYSSTEKTFTSPILKRTENME